MFTVYVVVFQEATLEKSIIGVSFTKTGAKRLIQEEANKRWKIDAAKWLAKWTIVEKDLCL